MYLLKEENFVSLFGKIDLGLNQVNLLSSVAVKQGLKSRCNHLIQYFEIVPSGLNDVYAIFSAKLNK